MTSAPNLKDLKGTKLIKVIYLFSSLFLCLGAFPMAGNSVQAELQGEVSPLPLPGVGGPPSLPSSPPISPATSPQALLHQPLKGPEEKTLGAIIGPEAGVFKVDVEVVLPGSPHSGTRSQAMDQARSTGFQKLWTRLAVAGAPPHVTEGGLKELVSGMSVVQEKITAHQYKGTFRLQFKADKVRGMLKQKQVSHSEIPSQPIFVFPLYVIGEQRLTFEEENTWRTAWKSLLEERKNSGALLHFVLVEKDTLPPSFQDLLDQDIEKVAQYLNQGKASHLLISQMTLKNPQESVLELKLNQITIDLEGKAHRFNPVIYRSSQSTLGDIMKKALSSLSQNLDTQWKQGTALKEEKVQETLATISIQDLEEWQAIAEKLKEISLIRAYKFCSFRPHEVEISISHMGEASQLRQGLAGYGLWAVEKDNKLTISIKKPESFL